MQTTSIAECRRKLEAGEALTASEREHLLDIEAVHFRTECAMAGRDPNKVLLEHAKAAKVVSLRTVRHFRDRVG